MARVNGTRKNKKNNLKIQMPVDPSHAFDAAQVDASKNTKKIYYPFLSITTVATIYKILNAFGLKIAIVNTASSTNIIIIGLTLLIAPYLLPYLKPKEQRWYSNIFDFLGIHQFGFIIAWIGSILLVILILISTFAAYVFGVGTKNGKAIAPQISWPVYVERTFSGNGGTINYALIDEYRGIENAIRIRIDTREKDSYAGWLITFGIYGSWWQNWENYKKASFLIFPVLGDCSSLLFGLKDKKNIEAKHSISSLPNNTLAANKWNYIDIDLTSDFYKSIKPSELNNFSFSLGHNDIPTSSGNNNAFYLEFYIAQLRFWNE